MTSDVPGAALGVAAVYFFWRWLREPNWEKVAVAALTLGLLQLTKTTYVSYFVLLPLLWVVNRWCFDTRRRSWTREVGDLSLMLVVALTILNMGYGFRGTFQRLGEYEFDSELLSGRSKPEPADNRFRGTLLGSIPVPFPRDYVLGTDDQREDFENPNPTSLYMAGEFHREGFWKFFPYAMALKIPLGTWGLLGVATAISLRNRRGHRVEWVVIATGLFLLLLVMLQSGRGFLRYALPVFPFLFICAGKGMSELSTMTPSARGVPLAFLGWSVLSSF